GRPVASPTQDMVIGLYYLTNPGLRITDLERLVEDPGVPKDQRSKADAELDKLYKDAPRFSTYGEVEMAVAQEYLVFESLVWYWVGEQHGEENGHWIRTAVGRVLFNSIVPDELGFLNKTFGKKELGDLVFDCFENTGLGKTTEFLDHLKNFGFGYATMGGISVGVSDLEVPHEKAAILKEAEEEVARFQKAYGDGFISNGERYNKVIDVWTHANNDVADAMVQHLERSKNGFNPVYMMMTSGARGNRDQMRQLAGMRGLMAKPQKKLTGGIGEIIESPIKANFREGLTVVEYFISTHGARKGLADTALKTADAGYLTRRLVDVAQDVTVTTEDCGTILGLEMTALKEGEDIIEPLADRIAGNAALEDIYDPIDGELLVKAGVLIDEDTANLIEDAGLQMARIRSVLTCESKRGICQMCYGRNLATMKPVDIGEAVGILAAQSIGEPGTQLTLRTFHIGGTAARIAAQTQRKSKIDGVVELERVTTVKTPDKDQIITSREGQILLKTSGGGVRSRLSVPYGANLAVKEGQAIKSGDLLFSWDPYTEPIVADVKGLVKFIDIVDEQTMREELDESTGRRQMTIIEDREKKLHPTIQIQKKTKKDEKQREFIVPVGAQLTVRDGDEINPGDIIAKISREVYKTRDITGGLPRVAELFEARRPKDPAVITEIDGVVSFGGIKRGKREVHVTPEMGDHRTYPVPVGKHMRVHEEDRVRAGDRLSEGPINPHDILAIKGPRAVQEYLLNEIQEVYRLQGVKINDKHIGVIVRQMLQKVRVTNSGDTDLLEGENVDRREFRSVNENAIEEGSKPARSEPLLLGITKASLTTESFISAASFQETTRVLTDAAVRGANDELRGLKENIIIGHLIPAGTGVHRYDEVE
ncbi:MAG: hypothetical protein OSB36_09805, partial [Longimicrobiales bacterium]|nr:hypothetical protein [Longimicrobiales bacterium]